MNQFKMNTFQMMAFVKMYQKEEVLWNTNLIIYKDRQFRRKALKRIVAGMNIDGFGIKEVAQKIKNLRSTYFQEVRKIERSKLTGSPGLYKPRVPWFGIVESCLGPRARGETSSPAPSPIEVTTPVNVQLTMEPPSQFVKVEPMEPEQWGAEQYLEESLKEQNEYYNGFLNIKNEDVPMSTLQPQDSSRMSNGRQQEITPSTDTEFDMFGRYIASALKSLPYQNAISAQTGIMLALATEKRKASIHTRPEEAT